MLNNLGLGFVVTARDLASGVFTQLEVNFMRLDRRVGLGTARIESAFQRLGVAMTLFTVGTSTVGASLSLANAAGEFEQSVAAVAAVSGASATELQQLRDAAIQAGIATQFSPTEAVVGLRELAQAGFNAQESMQLLLPVLDLAGGSLGELSPQAAAGLASQAMKAFGLSVDEASLSVDRMLQAVNVFALNANELPLALGTASRGAQSLHQSLSETLIALGLVKNVVPGVERASTAVAVAMERMAEPEVQQRLRTLGVAVVDSSGHFRSFLDVLGEMAPALDRMTQAQRSAFLLKTFGREALGGVNAILTQVTDGLRTATGETLRGAAALGYLRKQFENAAGTAASFRGQMLDTFEGQKTLLAGSLETLAVVLGEPFAQVLKPLVAVVVDVVNGVLGVFKALPAPVKRAFAALTLGAGGVLTLVGAAIGAQVGLALLVVGLKVLGLTLGGLMATVLPAVAAVILLGVVVAGFVYAFQHNLGGLGDFARRVWGQVTLAFQGLVQLFQEGGFSGAVREELGRAENQGLKEFAIQVYQVAFRIQRFFSGIAEGFGAALEAARPTFQAFLGAVRQLGQALGLVGAAGVEASAGLPSSEFAAFGRSVGKALGGIAEWLTVGLTVAVQLATGVLAAFRTAWFFLTPAVNLISTVLRGLWAQLLEGVHRLGFLTGATQGLGDVFQIVGEVVGFVAGVVGTALGLVIGLVATLLHVVVAVVRAVVEVLRGLADFVEGLVFIIGGIVTGDWAAVWLGFKKVVFSVVNTLVGVLTAFMEAVAAVVDAVAGIFGKDLGAAAAVRKARAEIEKGLGKGFGAVEVATPAPPRALNPVATSAMPAVSQVAAQAEAQEASFNQLASFPPPASATPAAANVSLVVDGEVLARATARAEKDTASRSFSPMPAY